MNQRIIIGDVHGNLKTLKKLVDKLPKNIPITMVGDLIDRGDNSLGVVDYVINNGYDMVLGNHEESMIRAYKNKFDLELWLSSEGKETRVAYENDKSRLEKHLSFFKQLPDYIEYDLFDDAGRQLLVTHAPVLNHLFRPLSKLDKEDFLWTRGLPKENLVNNEYFNVFGHNIVDLMIRNRSGYIKSNFKKETLNNGAIINNYIGYAAIDTGVCKNKLTAISFPEKQLFQQDFVG